MEEKQNRRFSKKRILREVHIQGLDVAALLSCRSVSPDVLFGNSVQVWGELETQYALEWELGRQQQRASLAGPEINERVVFKSNIEGCQNMLEAYRIDSSIVIPFKPVRAGNVEIAEIRPSSEPAIRVNTVLPVKLAGLDIRTQRLSCTVLSKEMNRQKKAPAKAGHETALPQRLLNSGN